MPDSTKFDKTAEKLREDLDSLWAAYQQAPPEDKPKVRERYLEALRRFSALVNPQ
jgi:hypothetical protein